MTNINVRVVGSANMTAMTGPFAKLQAQVTALNAQLEKMVALQNGVDPKGYQRMTRAAAENSRVFRNAAASTGMFEVQQLRVNKATDDFTSKLQKQKVSFGEMLRQQKLVSAAYRDQLRLQNMVATTSTFGTTHGKMTVDATTPNLVARTKGLEAFNQKLAYGNMLLKSGATQMINWGKNTQWAGRQLSMGLTMPIAALGAAAGVMAYQVDQALTRVQKVYNTTAKSGVAQQRELDQVRTEGLKSAMTAAKEYGSSAQDTLNVQADLAAAGRTGVELQKDTISVMRISRLGDLDYQDAIKSTIALQSVFNMNNTELAKSFNYINAVENATSLQTQDFAKAIPIAAGPVKAFGGNLQELGTLLVAMKEKGIEATQGANAIKAAMQRLGRPSKQVQEDWKQLTGTDITKIFHDSTSLLDMFTKIGQATDQLGNKDKIKAFAGLFGTYQVTRMMALVSGMKELGDTTTQTGQAFQLAGQDSSKWAKIAAQEIDRWQNSISGKWDRAIAEMKLQLSTLGKPFVEVATGIISHIAKLIEKFNGLSDTSKRLIAIPILLGAIAGPVIMLTGLFANLFGNGLKMLSAILPKMELFTTTQRAAALAAKQDADAMLAEVDAGKLLEIQLNKITAAQMIANKEMRSFRLEALMAQGLDKRSAGAQIRNEDARMTQAMGNIGTTTNTTATNTGKIARYAKLSAASFALSAAAMVVMMSSSNKTVDHIAEIVMYAGMLAPALIPIGSKFVSSLSAGVTEAKAVSGAMASARAGAAGFAAEMGMASLATGGVLLAVAAIGAAWYFSKKNMDAIEAKQKAILDKQISANKTLVSTSANFAANLGKAAGSYDSMISGQVRGVNSSITGAPATSMTYKSFKYYTQDETGKADAKSLKASFADTDAYMAKLKQQYLDLQKIGGLSAKQAMEAIQGELIAVGKSGEEAALTARSVNYQVGKLAKTDWANAMYNSLKVVNAELAKTAAAAGANGHVTYTPYYSVDWKARTEDYKKGLAGIKAQLDEFAGVFNTAWNNAMNPAQARKAIKSVTDASLSQFKTAYQQLASSPEMQTMLQGKGIKNARDLAEAVRQGTLGYNDLQGAAGKVGSANYLDPQAMKAMLDQARAFEAALIGSVSKSNDLDDSVQSTAGFIAAMARNAKQMNFSQAKKSAIDLFQTVVRAQGILAVEKSNNMGGTNQVGVAQAKSALRQAQDDTQRNLAAIAYAKNIKIGGNAAQTLYNILHGVSAETGKAADGAKKVRDALHDIPTRISIVLNRKEVVSTVHDAMSSVQDDMATSATDAFNARWDAAAAASQAMWSKRETALQAQQAAAQNGLQRRQQNASDAMDKRFQKHEDAVNKRYQQRIDAINKEIKAEQDADAQRQKMYEAEKKRMQDLADMANKNIDFNTALNSGNFDDAAKIRNDMEAQQGANTLDAIEARRSAAVQKNVDRLQKKIDNLEKMRDKELKRLQNVEDAQKKHLQRMQENQTAAQEKAQAAATDALKKREDADMASQQKTRDYEEAMLNQRLDLFKTYVAKNQKDLERWMKQVGLTYNDFGSDIKAKGESWASYFQKALQNHIRAAGIQIQNDNMWEAIGPKMAAKLLKGLGFPSLAAFQKFINTGRLTQLQRGGGQHHTGGHEADVKQHKTSHGGGMIGHNQHDNRKGLRGYGGAGGLHPSETWARVQHGEYLVNKKDAYKNRSLLDYVNSGGVGGYGKIGRGGSEPVLPVVGQLTSMIANGFTYGTEAASRSAMAAYKKRLNSQKSSNISGGFQAGPGGKHRPVPAGIGLVRGIHDQYTGYPAVDIASGLNTPAYAVANGVITRSEAITSGGSPGNGMYSTPYTSYGNVIYLKTDGGPTVLYAHLNKRMVSAGKRVTGGSRIGLTGNTGNSTGPHLHFGDSDGNPYEFLRKGGTVRFDNTPAMLHRGETVLTNSLTQRFKDNVASGGNVTYDVDVSVVGSELDPNDIADAVIKKIERKESRKPSSRRNRNN